jgi:hypothetical protein
MKPNDKNINSSRNESSTDDKKPSYTTENEHKILHIPGEQSLKVATDEEIKEDVKRINPDRNSMESRG